MGSYYKGMTKKEIEENNKYWHRSKDFDPDISYSHDDVENKIISHTELDISRALDEIAECLEPTGYENYYSDKEREELNKMDKIPRDRVAQEIVDRHGGTLETAIMMTLINNCGCISKRRA